MTGEEAKSDDGAGTVADDGGGGVFRVVGDKGCGVVDVGVEALGVVLAVGQDRAGEASSCGWC